MTLLIYLMFLNIAADVLYSFPYNQGTSSVTVAARGIAKYYLQWLSLDIGIVWIFAVAALHWPIWKYYYSHSNRHGSGQKTLLELMLPHEDIAYFTTPNKTTGGKKWYILVFLGLSASTVFNVHIRGLF